MRILIATDAWKPQVNGVVRSLEFVAQRAARVRRRNRVFDAAGLRLGSVADLWRDQARPGQPRGRPKRLEGAAIDHIHIATEGPVGFAARRYCLRAKRPFTTSYHTRFPEYIAARTRLPEAITYALLRRFHNAGSGVMVSTASIASDLTKPRLSAADALVARRRSQPVSPAKASSMDLPRPIFLYAGRLAPEKNVEAFWRWTCPDRK